MNVFLLNGLTEVIGNSIREQIRSESLNLQIQLARCWIGKQHYAFQNLANIIHANGQNLQRMLDTLRKTGNPKYGNILNKNLTHAVGHPAPSSRTLSPRTMNGALAINPHRNHHHHQNLTGFHHGNSVVVPKYTPHPLQVHKPLYVGQKRGYWRIFLNKSWNNLKSPPLTKRVNLVSQDQMDPVGWSPREIFPPILLSSRSSKVQVFPIK